MNSVSLAVSMLLVSNLAFSWFLGLDLCFDRASDRRRLIRYGVGLSSFLAVAAVAGWVGNRLFLDWLGLDVLQPLLFVLIIVGMVSLTHRITRAISVQWHREIAGDISAIAANSAVLGVVLIAVRSDYTAFESLVAGFFGGLGLMLAAALLGAVLRTLELEWIPEPMRGVPIALICAGLIAMAFLVFDPALLAAIR
ncbi:MAG: hypothetical protein EA403_12750 [Spirochaetaceae bacterium]|nr:MAG: hypothetical protein EA403_12750 [Spirochaetaceae bacterium]